MCDTLAEHISQLHPEYLFFNESLITSEVEIPADKYIEFHAGNNIQLFPGFETLNGSTFTAIPDGCQNLN